MAEQADMAAEQRVPARLDAQALCERRPSPGRLRPLTRLGKVRKLEASQGPQLLRPPVFGLAAAGGVGADIRNVREGWLAPPTGAADGAKLEREIGRQRQGNGASEPSDGRRPS